MNVTASSLCIAAFLICTARADLTLVQHVEGAGPATEVTMKIKGDKARIDASSDVTMIFDAKTEESLHILHSQKTVVRTSTAQAKRVIAAITGPNSAPASDGAAPAKVKVIPTGKKETIDGYEAEEYQAQISNYKASYWIAKSYPDGESIMKQLQAVAPQALGAGAAATPDFREFPGLPIRTNMTMGEMKVVSTLKSVRTDPLDDSEFTVPEGYKEMKVPQMSRIFGAKLGKPADTKSATFPKP